MPDRIHALRPPGAPRGTLVALCAALGLALACGGRDIGGDTEVVPPPPGPQPLELRLNEVVANNEGVWVDEQGETDDYIELWNASDAVLSLADYRIEDGSGEHQLPSRSLAPGEALLVWADDSPEQGQLHLPFKVSASGERLRLLRDGEPADGAPVEVDALDVPALEEHQAFQRMPDGVGPPSVCAFATPARANGERCGPPPYEGLPEELHFADYAWPEPWPELPSPLRIDELMLGDEAFVELANGSSEAVDLTRFSLRLAPQAPGEPWPDATLGTALAGTDAGSLAPGARTVVTVEPELAAAARAPGFAGTLTLFDADGQAVDRVSISHWPADAALARAPELGPGWRFCTTPSPGEANDACAPLASRPLADHVGDLLTPGDFSALAAGRQMLGTEAVEVVVDLEAGDVVTFLDSATWDLHYSFVREAIEHEPHLDRCDPAQKLEFERGWYAFSVEQYFRVEGRRYLLATLVKHAGTNLQTLQFSPGDVISSEQMEHAFFTVMRHVGDPTAWAIRPQSPDQVTTMRAIEGRVPIVDPNAPYRGVTFQPLTAAVGFGTLRFVPVGEIDDAALGPRDILVTDLVPNDVPPVGGLITESFQTPLAHVNVLSRGRGTPNMALADARHDPRVEPFLGQLVRLEVSGADFSISLADPAEANAYWESRRPDGPLQAPRLDTTVRGVQDLAERSIADMPALGAKAAQLAELGRVPFCVGSAHVPSQAFGVPVVHSLEHFAASGAEARLAALRDDPAFRADPVVRAAGLAEVRELILDHPVDPELAAALDAAIDARWPGQSLRFRSSSNTEDLPTFNGAGLYESVGVDPDDPATARVDALRTVWASLYSLRAYDEREAYAVDPTAVAMGVLVHGGFRSEAANGVAISRDALDPTRSDRYYINAQIGEALVTNPAPGVTSDELIYDPVRSNHETYHSTSSLTGGERVMSSDELAELACNLDQIHTHFRALLDPDNEDSWFAMDIEFKLLGPERSLLIKQARPYSFGEEAPIGWCDF